MLGSSMLAKKGVGDYLIDEIVYLDSFSTVHKGYNMKTNQEVTIRTFESAVIGAV